MIFPDPVLLLVCFSSTEEQEKINILYNSYGRQHEGCSGCAQHSVQINLRRHFLLKK